MSHRGHPSLNTPNAARPLTIEPNSWEASRSVSRASSAAASRDRSAHRFARQSNTPTRSVSFEDDDSDFGDDLGEMGETRPPLHRPTGGRSHQPLLHNADEDADERGRTGHHTPSSPGASARPPLFTRRSTLRSRSPDTQAKLATKKKYTYAAFFLVLSLISFVIQTETAVYIQSELGWNKAYCML
jgi:hypothetical protein